MLPPFRVSGTPKTEDQPISDVDYEREVAPFENAESAVLYRPVTRKKAKKKKKAKIKKRRGW